MSILILASTSAARHALLSGLGLPFDVEPPNVDEDLPLEVSVERAVAELARRKALAVSRLHPEVWVLGADQLVSFEGSRLGKPADRSEARAQLQRLAGQTHDIFTGVCLTNGHQTLQAVERTRLEMYPLQTGELEHYLDLEEWRGCAGGYRIEGHGQLLMARIDGDRSNVQGLPMVSVVRLLREVGLGSFSPTQAPR